MLLLLELDGGTGSFELFLELLGVFLGQAGLDGLGRAVDEVLGFLESQAGGRPDNLDDVDLLGTVAFEEDLELGLDRGGFGGWGGSATSGGSDGYGRGSRFDAVHGFQVIASD